LIIVGAVVLVGAAVAAGVMISRGGQPKNGGTASPSVSATATPSPSPTTPTLTPTVTPTVTPSRKTLQTLPSSAPIPQSVVLVPLRRGGGSDRPIYLVDSEGATDPVPLSTPPGANSNPMMQASRDTITYLNGGVLRVMAADGSEDRRLLKNEPAGCDKVEHASWNLADPNVILISCKVSEDKYAFYVIGLDGRLIRRLDAGRSVIGDFGVSPDGQTVVYWASNNPNLDGGAIFTLPIIGTGAPKQLTTSADGVDADPAWSPDGTQIAFRRRVPNGTLNGNQDVYVMSADGTGVRRIAGTPAADFKPIWSPDSKNLLIISNRKSAFGGPGKTFDLWLTRVSDGEVLTNLGLKAKQITRPFWTLR
jgi:Tol biopolymer transport system component